MRHRKERLFRTFQGTEEGFPGCTLPEEGKMTADNPHRDGEVRLGRRIISRHEEDHQGRLRLAVRRRKSREMRKRSEEYWRPISSPSSM
jgi:hypothetical protein